MDGRDIIVTNNMPVGTLLGTFTTDLIKTYQCANVKNIITGARVHGEFATYIGNIRVYKTNIAGIGYTLGSYSMCGDVYFPAKGRSWSGDLDDVTSCGYVGAWNTITHKFYVRIYKIGATGNGYVATRKIGESAIQYRNPPVSWAKGNPIFLNTFKITTIGDDSSGQGNNNSGGQGSNNNGGQGNNNGGEQGNQNWNRQDNRDSGGQGNNSGGGQGGNQNNNSIWPSGNQKSNDNMNRNNSY